MTTGTWRGIAAEDVDEVTGGLAALLRRRARRLLFSLLRPQSARVAVTFALIVTANLAALAGPWLVGVAIDRGIPPAAARRDLAPLALYVAGFAAAVAIQAVASRGFIYSMGKLGETVRAGAASAAVPALPAAAGVVPRALHVGAGHLPAGIRHRLHLRPVRRRPGRPGVRGAVPDPRRGRDAAAGLAARAGGAGRVRAAGLADDLVPARVRGRLPADPGNDRAGHRAFRGDLRRYPRGAGVPPGAAQRGDLRQPQRRLRGGQPARPGCSRCTRPGSPWSATWRPACAVLRRAAGDRRGHQGRRADHVPALPGPVLRPAAGSVAVLQLLPVRGRLTGEDLRRARGRPRCRSPPILCGCRPAAGRPPSSGAARSGSSRCGSATGAPGYSPGWISRSRPGRPWPWWVPRAPGRPPSPGCWPASRPRPGQCPAGRRRPARPAGPGAAPGDRPGHPGELRVHGVGGRQHTARPAGRDPGRGRGRGPGHRRGHVHLRAARWVPR